MNADNRIVFLWINKHFDQPFFCICSECLSTSCDNDQLSAILIATTTASIVRSLTEGIKIDFKMSLATSKSNARSIPLANRNLIVSFPSFDPLSVCVIFSGMQQTRSQTKFQ